MIYQKKLQVYVLWLIVKIIGKIHSSGLTVPWNVEYNGRMVVCDSPFNHVLQSLKSLIKKQKKPVCAIAGQES
ncbi:MAG: hypothetical protein JJU29_01205 [Verrucomicrobia bacterium]|nr:hypothetical protein [Verrucomicrobiota bacterium]MCH8510476.1 hypothetical protein [Kiritimatiellia bacterium]